MQQGTLKQGDIVLAGLQYGRVRAMLDENGEPIETPVQVFLWRSGPRWNPDAGDPFVAVESEKRAREIADFRQEKMRHQACTSASGEARQHVRDMTAGEVNAQSRDQSGCAWLTGGAARRLADLGNDEVKVNVVVWRCRWYYRNGCVAGNDQSGHYLSVSMRVLMQGPRMAENEGVEVRYYNVIYDLIDDVKAALTGMFRQSCEKRLSGLPKCAMFPVAKVWPYRGLYGD